MSTPEQNEMSPMQRIVGFLQSDDVQKKLTAAAAPGVEVGRYTQLALASIGRNDKLQTSTLQSLAQSLLESCSLGLPISSTIGYGCLVPYKGKASFQPMYLGKLRLAYNEGGATTAAAEVVRIGDEFDHELGNSPRLRHVKKSEAGAPIHFAYGIVHVQNGPPFLSVWTESELQEHASQYVNKYQIEKGEALYVRDFPAWCKKTALSRAIKLMPMRSELARQVMQREEVMDAGDELDDETEPRMKSGDVQTPANLKELAKAAPMPEPELVPSIEVPQFGTVPTGGNLF